MERLSREALLGASDLKEKEVELPSVSGSVRVRGLSAAYANEAQSKAVEVVQDERGDSVVKVNKAKLEALEVLHGLVDPKLNSLAEAETFLKNCGPAANRVVEAIDELTGIDPEDIEAAEARFPGNGEGEAGPDGGDGDASGDGGPSVPTRTGA